MGIFLLIIFAAAWALEYYADLGYGFVLAAVMLFFGLTIFNYYRSDTAVLKTLNAKEIKKEDNPYVYRMVENLCLTAGIPHPKIYIMESPAMNAFATGRDPEHASIALTTGLIEKLANEELEGVIAHELSHIKNYDIRLMTVVLALVGVITIFGDRLWFFRNFEKKTGNYAAISIMRILLVSLSPIIAELIKLAISRKREFLADASAALLTRYPEGLARALEKISASAEPLNRASVLNAHLFTIDPLRKQRIFAFSSTHPPVEQRIKILREM